MTSCLHPFGKVKAMDYSSSVTVHPFLRAAARGDLKMLRKLVDDGEGDFAKIRDSNGCTALHVAAGEGKTGISKYLTKILKFDVDLQDDQGYTPLCHTIEDHHLRTAVTLVRNGASMTITDNNHCTPLHIAASHGGGKSLLELFVSGGADIEAISDGGTPLTRAALVGDDEALEFLLQNNANADPVNTPNTPIMGASYYSLKATDLLVKAGANPNINFCGETPLQHAAASGKVDIITYLLKAEADPNIVNFAGMTPLELAAYYGENMKAASLLFPVTTRIPCIPEWSIRGVMEYVKSREMQEKSKISKKEYVELAISKGAEAFQREEYWVAINWYLRAEGADTFNATIYSNKSICFARMNRRCGALNDARKCVQLRPYWAEAHCREAAALMLFKKYKEAAKSYSIALKLEPNNIDIQKKLKEAIEEAESAGMSI